MKNQVKKQEIDPMIDLDRRDFLQQGLAAMAAVMIFGSPAMAGMFDVSITREQDSTPVPGMNETNNVQMKRREAPVPEIAKLFLNEKLKFEIRFLTAKTAHGKITFKRTGRVTYTASVEATLSGVVTTVIKHRKHVMTSSFQVDKVNGKERFVTLQFYRKQIRTDGTRESRNEFDYLRRRWRLTKFKNGKRTKKRTRRIPKNVYYDDIVNLLFNMRAQVYGPVAPGKSFVLNTMPWSRKVKMANGKKKRVTAKTIGVHIAAENAISDDDRKWMKQVGGKYLFIVKLDPDVYGIKSGQAKFIADAKLKPVGAKVKDAVGFGDVVAHLV